MHNEEQLLTNFSFITGLKDAKFTLSTIAQHLNQQFKYTITPRQLRYFMDKVTRKAIHPEYNNIIMLDTSRDAWDKNLNRYCVDFHGLLITYKSLANLTD